MSYKTYLSTRKSKVRPEVMMEGPTCTWIVAVCVFTEILLLTTAQVERMRNLALNKACDTSSRYNEYTKYSGNCSAAINGLINTYFQLSSSPPNCIHTSTSDNSPFWWVDLGQNFSVHEVTIYARTGSLKRMQCVRVSLDGREIYTFPSSGIANVTTGIYLHPPEHGRVVNITRNCISAGDSVPLLNICEVQIWGCTNGSWGDDCQYQCSPWCQGSGEDNYCDSDTGTCLKGCMLGYWGDNCTFTCGEGCNGSACNMSDGTCECRPGWESPLCQNCSDGYYNVSNDCQNTCGRGCNDICSRTDGTCQCQQGWQPPLCQSCSSGHYNVSNDCQDTCGEGCNDTCSRTNGTCLCHQGWQPPLCQDCLHGHFNVSNDCHNICGRGCHDTCKSTDGTCQCETGWESPMCQKCSIGHWGDNCSNSCAIGCQNAVCDAVNGTCQCKRGWAAPHCDYCSDNYYSVSSDCQNTCGEGCNNTCNRTDGTCLCRPGWDSPLCQRQSTSEITKTNAPVGAIVGSVVAAAVAVVIVIAILYLRRRQQHKGSRPRLQAFPDKFLSTSRQQLSTDDAESEIESEQSVAVHARKGPRFNTVDDLWWMVWQENVTQIIMLTSLIEGGKGGDQRTVSQYHYLVWPDHGVPSTYSLVSFWRYVKARAQGDIPVVHCSAGVGRTGTYIALDIASDLRSRGRDVNIKEIVSRLREDRMLMVQTEEQYKFLHEAILEEHTSRTTRMTFDQFDFTFPDTINIHKESRVDKEFKMVCQMGEFVARPKYTLAASRENMHKNQCQEFLPDDDHLVYLTGYVPGRNQYINAVHMSSFRKRQGLILTQLPLPDTVVDMWRMIDGWDVNTIVSLGHRDQSKSVKNYCRYWPETDKDTLKAGPYSISLTSSSALGDHLTCYNLSLTTKALKTKTVRVLYYDDWKELVPSRISDILQLTDILESWRVEDEPSPVVVQCSDGMTRSGMFCALYDVINRARNDQEIDVYLSVRQVRTVRQHAITSEVQYRYCYQAAQEYKRQYSVYQNT